MFQNIKICSGLRSRNQISPYLYFKIQSIPKRKESITITEIIWSVQLNEVIAICSENHRRRINTLRGQITELLTVKPGGTCSYLLGFK
jgi:hypothetical protein